MHKLTLASEPGEVLGFLRPILQPIYEALEVSVPSAFELIEERGWKNTATLASHIVRADAKSILDGRSCPVEYDDTSRTVIMDSVCNEGLSTDYEEITIKIWKGTSLPRAHSQPRRSFYQHTLPLWKEEGTIPLIRSLVVLWDCDSQGSNLRLSLCCPKDYKGTYVWLQSIPHPSQWMIVEKPVVTTKAKDFDDVLEDQEKGDKKKKNVQ